MALEENDEQEIHEVKYHELNPMQYHEVNPKHTEAMNSKEYVEMNPRQYTDKASNSRNDDDTVKLIDIEHTDNAIIYNVQQPVKEFIIGEYGTITNTGQPLQGVRYAAVADDQSGVDRNFIYKTLVKYFPMMAQNFSKNISKKSP